MQNETNEPEHLHLAQVNCTHDELILVMSALNCMEIMSSSPVPTYESKKMYNKQRLLFERAKEKMGQEKLYAFGRQLVKLHDAICSSPET